MTSFENDWTYFKAAVPLLYDYLLSAELFWPPPVSVRATDATGALNLSLGNVLLFMQRLKASNVPGERAAAFASLEQQVNETRTRWQANWQKKAQAEFNSRVTLWQNYLNDFAQPERPATVNYHYAIRWRVILDLLTGEPGAAHRNQSVLEHMDGRLRALVRPGQFIWEPELADGFPKERYWYLYVTLP
ncbi:MAG: hypothetical protein GYA17_01220 [Chloroflexi bacterium]|jgi:hypothetical protein|nr:hypothetical protein [Anaerolineaceae bacterium]NMB86945.1 hypothetical protein [Chloroflexota bacterium]